MSEKLLLNTHLSIGKAKIKYKINSALFNASDVTKGDLYSIKGDLSRMWNINHWILTGRLGGIYERFRVDKLNGKGEDINLTVSTRKGDKATINLGFSIKRPIAVGNFSIFPELHFNVENPIYSKNSSALISLNGKLSDIILSQVNESYRPIYNVGGTVSLLKQNLLELGIGYDFSFKKRFTHHSAFASCSFKL